MPEAFLTERCSNENTCELLRKLAAPVSPLDACRHLEDSVTVRGHRCLRRETT